MAFTDVFETKAPGRTFRFKVSSDAFSGDTQFSNITGLGATTDVVEYREGNDLRDTPIKLPGMVKYGNITLKRGMSGDATFLNWILGALPTIDGYHGVAAPSTLTIDMLDDGESEAIFCSMQVINAWPANLTMPDLNASSSEVAIETLELVHEGLVFVNGEQPYNSAPKLGRGE